MSMLRCSWCSGFSVEAIKAVNSLKALSSSKEYPIDLTIGDGKLVMANPDDKGQAEPTEPETTDEVTKPVAEHKPKRSRKQAVTA